MSSHVAVITDSAASVPTELVDAWGLDVVPLQVIVDDDTFLEDESFGPDAVLDALESGNSVSTSQPTVAAFADAFARAADAGASSVVAVLISSKLSGTVNAARVAAESAPIPVTVVDSLTLAMGTGFAAIAASALAQQGASAQEVAAQARRVAESSHTIFTVDTLEFLRRGGRMPAALAAVGQMLSVRPVFEIVDGVVEVAHRVRTTSRARQAVISRAQDLIATMARPGIAVMTLGEQGMGAAVESLYQGELKRGSMLVRTQVSAVLAVHTGPGTVAVVVADLPAQVH